MQRPVADREQRRTALSPERSFIVQAPAGSGKTELLIQRYLRLLAIVDAPEEIIAITFTRKAAGEMRNRILDALQGSQQPEPEKEHEQLTWSLARDALDRDREQGWELERNPGRLRIQTIDALCAGLTRQMPLLSGLGGQPGISEDAQALYLEAARATVRGVEEGEQWSAAVGDLLRHLDNQTGRVEEMVATMLARRDQWLRHVAGADPSRIQRQALEMALQRVVGEFLEELHSRFPHHLTDTLLGLVRFAAGNLLAEGSNPEHRLLPCASLETLPAADLDALPQWQGLAELLLTKDGALRKIKGVNKNLGFPPAKSAPDTATGQEYEQNKKVFAELLEQLQECDSFLTQLAQLSVLPPVRYSGEQWHILQALFQLLKLAVAQLKLVMSARGKVDFIEMAERARLALGNGEQPTELAMLLDYRIRHILIDEFQDTAFGQFDLLQRLIAGWEPDDGRTLFAVGDPMQSIYRFREAEVGLYLAARRDGIGGIELEPVNLTVNFRSQQGIVEWVNQVFRRLFPTREDISSGAVTYAPSEAYQDALGGAAMELSAFIGRSEAEEAERVAALVREGLATGDGQSIAVLVRNRTHLQWIVPALKKGGIRFQALEVDPLKEQPVIHDLLALTRALLHPADRLSWLAVLRAPWCGFTLEDLHRLAGDDQELSIWELMQEQDRVDGLSGEGRRRLLAIKEILQQAFRERRRGSLRAWLERIWQALGGTAVLRSCAESEQARTYFELIQELEECGDLGDFSALEQAVAKLYAPPDPEADGRVQVMTIHKAKGLEFDRVILPGLGRPPRVDDTRLMQWLERPLSGGPPDLLMAPVKGVGEKEDAIYRYLKKIDDSKARHEEIRLLYVAATRAKQRLYLLGHTEYDPERELLKPPKPRSLLAALWPAAEELFAEALSSPPETPSGPREEPVAAAVPLRRLPPGWEGHEEGAEPPWEIPEGDLPETEEEVSLEFDWAGEAARHVGTVVHRYLQRMAEQGLQGWDRERVRSLSSAFQAALRHCGVTRELLPQAAEKVEQALCNVLADERGRWILQQHREHRSEYALTTIIEGGVKNVILDRTFVDAEGTRWIIDYKSGSHEGGSREQFLDREQERYRLQLEGYAEIIGKNEQRPIRLGLYFPLLGGWREWAP
jgi:ATP-dependent exoDNAse (exonuclease V) beta subunit